jgi:[ribosomal protein S5]-alanine N-acetyltransferase
MGVYDRFGGFPELETPRLRLREPHPDDADRYLEMLSDLEVQRFLPWVAPRTVEDSLRSLRQLKAATVADQYILPWAIALKPDGQLIGGIRYFGFSGHHYQIGEVGYEVAREHWRHGYATEALRAVVAFGFDRLELVRVQLSIRPDNLASRRVAQKAGFTEEGTLRCWGYDEARQAWVDTLMAAIVRDDYYLRARTE